MNYKTIEKKIDDISITSSREERKQLGILKKMISSLNDTLTYEAYNDKRLKIANYNKLLIDTENLDMRTPHCYLFFKMPGMTISFYDEQAFERNMKFFELIKNILSNFPGCKQTIYNLGADYFVLICDKKNVSTIYDKIKTIKKSKNYWRKIQMTFLKYSPKSSKTSKNLSLMVKEALKVFKGENKEAKEEILNSESEK